MEPQPDAPSTHGGCDNTNIRYSGVNRKGDFEEIEDNGKALLADM